VNPGFCKKWKLLAYHLEDLRVPQVGNPWVKHIKCFIEYHMWRK